MGLDGVELVMEVEDRFDISIPDDHAEHMRTVGDMCDYLSTRARSFLDCPCPTASHFYTLRRVLINQFGIERSGVRPTTPMKDLFPQETRFEDWRRLSDQLGSALPPLRWPRFAPLLCLCLFVAPIVATMLVPHLATFLLATVGSIVLLIVGYRVGRRWVLLIPEGAATVGALTRTLVKNVYLPTDRDPAELEAWIRNQVFDIVSDVLNVERGSVKLESRFVEDLGMS